MAVLPLAGACSKCKLRNLCIPTGLNAQELLLFDQAVSHRRVVKRGAALVSNAEAFKSIYAVRSGFFKTCVSSDDGREQVTGFQMAGDIIGLDGIGEQRYRCDVLALEDSEVCVLPFDRVEELSRQIASLQHHIYQVMSNEIVRDHGVLLLLGSMRAEERLASFLLNLTDRMHARGFSQSALVLRMTREEIGSFLGLTLETVSRTFSKFAESGLIEVKQRDIRIVDAQALAQLAHHNPQTCQASTASGSALP